MERNHEKQRQIAMISVRHASHNSIATTRIAMVDEKINFQGLMKLNISS
jgi:hypothetical protein